jgi:hypothetical protein
MTAVKSDDIVATQALPETIATLYTSNNIPYNHSAKHAGPWAAAQFVSHAYEVRVKNGVLQVSNRAECFILATEPHRPAARMWMPADLGSKLLHFHTSCRSSCLTDQRRQRSLLQSRQSLRQLHL